MITVLDDARFINLLSFKRDGSGVETPVWAATLHGKLVIYTNGDSYKVKRIQRNPSVQVARCDVRGKLLGPWHDAVCAFATDEAKKKEIIKALAKKYGWQFRALFFFGTLAGRAKNYAYLEVSLV